ncbi:MAG: oligosaccharide flippase family protein [Alphaproteobacteria bacterium]|nr:oligosaccharide flippase family protein [Alphaproteobacteria bacterium]
MAAYFDAPSLADLLVVAAFVPPLFVPGQPFQAVLERNLRFGLVGLCDAVGSVAQIVVVWMLLDQGIISMVWSMLVAAGLRSLGMVVAIVKELRPSLTFDLRICRPTLRFGMFRTGELILIFLGLRMDQIVIAGLFGQHAIGLHAFAWRLTIDPVMRINSIFGRVLFPALSNLKDEPAEVRRLYLENLRVICFSPRPCRPPLQ